MRIVRIKRLLKQLRVSLKGKVRYIFLVLIILLLCGGYWYISNVVFTDVPKAVIEYCSNKYGKDFVWVSYDEEYSDPFVKVSNVSDGSTTFRVERYYDTDGNAHHKDNYLGYLHQWYIDEVVSSLPSKYGKVSVNISKSYFPDIEDSSISAKDFTGSYETVITLDIDSDKLWSTDDIEEFIRYFKDKFRINVYVVTSGEVVSHFGTTAEGDLKWLKY